MESPKREFETILLTEQDLRERQLQRAAKPIDAFDIDSYDADVEDFKASRSDMGDPDDDPGMQDLIAAQDDFLKNKRERMYDKFLKLDLIVEPEFSEQLWGIVLSSYDPTILTFSREIDSFFGDDYPDKAGMMKLYVRNALKNRVMPADTWLGFLRTYKEKLEEYDRKLAERTPEIRRFVVGKFIECINPDLEEPKTEAELMGVLEKVNLLIRDPLLSERSIATHTDANRTVEINAASIATYLDGEPSPKALDIFMHELLHAISSGQTVKHSLIKKDEDDFEVDTKLHAEWSGLAVKGFNVRRFVWMNEAVTEDLSSRAVGIETEEYKKERMLLDLFLTKGKKPIDLKLLINAYFERKGHQADPEEGAKFWKQLRQEAREAFDHDPQFIVKLDALVQEKGIDAAIELLYSWDSENPANIAILPE